MKLWTCRHCRSENKGGADTCEYCEQPKKGSARPETPLKPLPLRPSKGTPMYEMGLEAAAFISKIPIGGGTYDREAHRQHLVRMAKKYPGVGWEEAIVEWDGYCRKHPQGPGTSRWPGRRGDELGGRDGGAQVTAGREHEK